MAKHEGKGGLWINKYKTSTDSKPDFVGEITIQGTTHKIAGWQNSADGPRPVISLKVAEPKPTSLPLPAKAVVIDDAFDSDIPF